MELLPPISFASAIASSKERIERIANIAAKYFDKNKGDIFLKACYDLDFTTANNILDELVKELTGEEPVYDALNSFAEKFPQLPPDFSRKVSNALSEAEKVKAIESFRPQILNIINGSERK